MPVQTVTVGPGELTIGAATALMDFSSQCTSCTLTPSVDTGDQLNVLSGESVSGDRTETWALSATLLQDFGADDGTTEWLFDHRGEDHPFTYEPNSAKGKTIKGTLTVEAIAIGGDVKTKPTSDIEFALVGSPTIETAGGGGGQLDAVPTTTSVEV